MAATLERMLLRKDFSSLRKRVLSGVQPKNHLLPTVKRIGIPDETTINRGAICVVSPLNKHEKEKLLEMKTCYYLPLSIVENGLHEKPLYTLQIKSVQYNEISVHTSAKDLEFRVSLTQSHLFFCLDNMFVDKMAVPKGTIDSIWFSVLRDSILIVLHKRFGFLMICYEPRDDENLLRFFQKTLANWGPNCTVERRDDLHRVYRKFVKLRELLNKDPQMLIRIDNENSSGTDSDISSSFSSQTDLVLKSGLPSLPTPTRKPTLDGRTTRSATRLAQQNPNSAPYKEYSIGEKGEVVVEESAQEPEEPKEQEIPAPFDPPLKYSLANGKKFAITFNDFKTLYNNDWINDTLIDFFIAYEIDKAVTELELVKENEVYAFNSFFFTKLMSKPEGQEEPPDYYENIQRWLSKVDLMSYESVIIPINEHLHWYCCIIRHLPELLKAAKKRAKKEEDETKEDAASNGPSPDESPKKSSAVAEVFVFDSLRHRHPNIEEPLRTIIDRYCQDTHQVSIPKDLIRFVNARVPQQRNFNDCGIHVICNVGKWLGEPEVCETMWKKIGKKIRGYFNVAERAEMRKKLIDLLLDLHLKQPPYESSSGSGREEDESDDGIELISYFSSKPEPAVDAGGASTSEILVADLTAVDKNTETGKVSSKAEGSIFDTLLTAKEVTPTKRKKDVKTHDSSDMTAENKVKNPSPNLPDATPVRTLDPRAIASSLEKPRVFASSREASSGLFMQIEHPQIRRSCMRRKLKPHTVEFLNSFFTDHNKHFSDEKLLAIDEFVDKYNFFDTNLERLQTDILVNKLKDVFKEPTAPMDEPFVIHDADDSNGELNQSVGDLRIESDNPSGSDQEVNEIKPFSIKLLRSDSDLEIIEDKKDVPEVSFKTTHKGSPNSEKTFKHERHFRNGVTKNEDKEEGFLLYFTSKKGIGPKRRRLAADSERPRRADKYL